MKKYLALAATLLCTAALTACSADDEETLTTPKDADAITTNTYDESFFPTADGARQLSLTSGPQALYTLLKAGVVEADKSLGAGEMSITDEQWAELKTFVDENLRGDTETATCDNVFKWVVKNLTYSYDDAAIEPYDVFQKRRCVCQGYANLCRAMLLTQGIPAFGANGQLGNVGAHAWLYARPDSTWYVLDPTNNQQFKAAGVASYKSKLIVERVDVPLITDDNFEYSFENSLLSVSRVKQCDGESLTVPYSAGGYCVNLFAPRTAIPENVRALYFGTKITTFGPDEYPLFSTCPNVEEAYIDKASSTFSSADGVIYKGRNGTTPVYIPRGVRRLVLRPMETIGKNVVYCLDNVEEIVITEGTKTVEAYAIEQCPNLKRVYVSESVTSLDDNAIYRCGSNVEIIRVPTGIHNVTM